MKNIIKKKRNIEFLFITESLPILALLYQKELDPLYKFDHRQMAAMIESTELKKYKKDSIINLNLGGILIRGEIQPKSLGADNQS